MLKKFLLLVGILFVSVLPSFASAAEKTELDYKPIDMKEHWAYDSLSTFVNSDLLNGYRVDGEVYIKPDASITRAEFTAILVRVLGLENRTINTAKASFSDVKEGTWYYKSIMIARDYGIVSGMTDTTFEPNTLLQRDQVAVMIVRAFKNTVNFNEGTPKKFTDVKNYWATDSINQASRIGIVSGKTATLFKPSDNATRAEAITMINRALNLEKSNTPADELLQNLALTQQVELFQLLQTSNFNELAQINNTYNTGYSKALVTKSISTLSLFLQNGFDISFSMTGTPQTEVIQKSDRFAVVIVDEMTYKMTVTFAGNILSGFPPRTIDSITYFLKFMPNENKWQIYSSTLENLL